MRVFAICQDELVIRSLDTVLLPSFEVDFLVESRPLARRLHDAGIAASAGDPRRVDTYLKADISPSTCFIVEDNGRRSLKKILDAVRDGGGTLTYVLGIGAAATATRQEEFHDEFPDVTYLTLAELIGTTRSRVSFFMNRFRKLGLIDYNGHMEVHSSLLNIVLHDDPHIHR